MITNNANEINEMTIKHYWNERYSDDKMIIRLDVNISLINNNHKR